MSNSGVEVSGVTNFMGAVDGLGLVGVLVGACDGHAACEMLDTGRVSVLYCVGKWPSLSEPGTGTLDAAAVAAEARFDAVIGGRQGVAKVCPDAQGMSDVLRGGSVSFVYVSGLDDDERSAHCLEVLSRLAPCVLGGDGYASGSPVERVVQLVLHRADRVLPDATWVVYNPALRVRGITEDRVARVRGRKLSDIADGAFVVCFTGTPERAAAHAADCARVGLSVEQVWQFPTPFDKYFSDSVPHTDQFDGRPGWANSWFGHYRAMKLAYERGYESALIMEDDCRFLLDTAKLNEIVADIPHDSDFALLDHFYCQWDQNGRRDYEQLRAHRVTRYWSTFEYGFYSASCYLVSRKALARLIWLHESVIDPGLETRMMRVTDYWHNRGNMGPINMYFCTPNCAIQRNPDNSGVRLSDTSGINRYYVNMGIRFDAYSGGHEAATEKEVADA